MLRFTNSNGQTFGLHFNYIDGEDFGQGGSSKITEAVIHESQKVDGRWEDSALAVGSAVCHPSDQFCRETGRKLALSRALQAGWHGQHNYEFRQWFWTAYFGRRGNRD